MLSLFECLVRRPKIPRFVCCVFLSAIFVLSCLAQNTNSGEIRGTVIDPSGAAIPGVSVTILNTQTGVARDLVTNNSGIYDAVSVLPGSYSLTFTKEGFNKLVRSGIEITVNPVAVDAQLTIGAATQQVSVTEQAPILQTESGEQSTTLDYKTMQTLPNVGTELGQLHTHSAWCGRFRQWRCRKWQSTVLLQLPGRRRECLAPAQRQLRFDGFRRLGGSSNGNV